MNLKERRAWFVYEAARIENVAAKRPINPEPWRKRDPDFRQNMIRAVAKQCGSHRVAKIHPDMIPFDRLGRKEREKDWVFFMFCEIAMKIR